MSARLPTTKLGLARPVRSAYSALHVCSSSVALDPAPNLLDRLTQPAAHLDRGERERNSGLVVADRQTDALLPEVDSEHLHDRKYMGRRRKLGVDTIVESQLSGVSGWTQSFGFQPLLR